MMERMIDDLMSMVKISYFDSANFLRIAPSNNDCFLIDFWTIRMPLLSSRFEKEDDGFIYDFHRHPTIIQMAQYPFLVTRVINSIRRWTSTVSLALDRFETFWSSSSNFFNRMCENCRPTSLPLSLPIYLCSQDFRFHAWIFSIELIVSAWIVRFSKNSWTNAKKNLLHNVKSKI